jgi:hypothetical protein
MPNKKQSDLITEPAPDDAPPEEIDAEVIDVTPTSGVPAIPDLTDDKKLQQAVEVAERYFAFTEAVKKMALARTSSHHWAKYPRGDGYIYYLTGEGATNLIKGFGVQISNQQSVKLWSEDDLGRYYIWVYRADVFVPAFNLHIEGIEGRCSQRKAFFAKAGQEWKPPSEIDEANIMADAQTDLWRNIIRRTFGIGYETETTIADAKVDTSKIAAPSFKKGARKGSGLIKAKFASKCAACGKAIPKGAEIYYDRPNKKAYHPTCAPGGDGGEETAGESEEEAPAGEATETAAPENGQRTKLVAAITETAKAIGFKQSDLEKLKGDVWGKSKKLDDATVDELDKLYSRLLDLENAAAEGEVA